MQGGDLCENKYPFKLRAVNQLLQFSEGIIEARVIIPNLRRRMKTLNCLKSSMGLQPPSSWGYGNTLSKILFPGVGVVLALWLPDGAGSLS